MTRGIFVAGADSSASELNDCFAPPRCRVRNSTATVSITTSGTAQVVLFDTEVYDVGGMHSTVTNTGRITVPAGGGGLYGIGGHVRFAANATGMRELIIRINGTTQIARSSTPNSGATDEARVTIYTEYELVAGDYVELQVVQTSGGALNYIGNADATPVFFARWLTVHT